MVGYVGGLTKRVKVVGCWVARVQSGILSPIDRDLGDFSLSLPDGSHSERGHIRQTYPLLKRSVGSDISTTTYLATVHPDNKEYLSIRVACQPQSLC